MKPLGRKERRLVILAELYLRRHGRAPSWGELSHATSLRRLQLFRLLTGLQRKGAIVFDERERSLRVTRAGLDAALDSRADV